jgi:Na+(H+)/acetate symporter ActP
VLLTVSGTVNSGWAAALLQQPAAWTVPVAFAVMVAVSLGTRRSLPTGVGPIMVRLHAPEALDLDRGETRPLATGNSL